MMSLGITEIVLIAIVLLAFLMLIGVGIALIIARNKKNDS